MSENTEVLEVTQTNLTASERTFCDNKGVISQEYHRNNEDQVGAKGDTLIGDILELEEIVAPKLAVEDDLELQLLEVFDVPQDILFPQELNLHLQEKIKHYNTSIEHGSKIDFNSILYFRKRGRTMDHHLVMDWKKTIQINRRAETLSEEKSKLSRALEDRETEIQLLKARLCDSPPIPLRLPVANDSPEATTGRVTDLSRRVRDLSSELSATRIRCSAAELKISTLLPKSDEKPSQTSDGNSLVDPYKRGAPEYRVLVEKVHVANAKLFDSRNRIQQLRNELKMAYKVLQNEVGENVSISALMTGAGGWRGRAQQIQVLQQRVADLTTKLRSLASNQRCSNQVPSGDAVVEPRSTVVRRMALKQAQQEAAEATAAASDGRKRLEAAKARIALLSSEATTLRTRLKQLLDKGRRDEQYISLLQKQSSEQATLLREKEEALRSEQERHETDVASLKEDLAAERQRCQQLTASLGTKDSRIHILEGQLWEKRSSENGSAAQQNRTDDPQNSDTNVTLHTRNTECNHQNPDTQVMAERHRLVELVAVVNGRLSAARKEADLVQEALQRERQRTARLETRLSRIELDRVGASSSGLRRTLTNRLSLSAPPDQTVALTDKLQLAEELVLTLQTRIDTLEKEKEDDLRRFAATLAVVSSRN